MSVGTQTCDIVIPGYTLAERIGSGGYAEVWRAEAPGGIEKAVKIVYGFHDDEFAAQELKALERIKGVRHTFLLSLERFEVINGRLAILTELADMSLDQRLRQCRATGLTGIPRDELLQYMADAAEALDFLSQRHSLQHLDIKPENLLILGDHIKVADFGLVKELATRTQNSLVSGMTPTYASPEMFDDEPSAHSDQYSLAIVFQEMLVSALPFPGRTSAQLAKQHTQSEPQLQALPPDDRPIVAKALAKKPEDRYPSCRAFVDALFRRASTAPAIQPHEAPRPAPARPSTPGIDDTKPPSVCTTIRRSAVPPVEPPRTNVTQPVSRGARPAPTPDVVPAEPVEFVPEEITDVPFPSVNPELNRAQPTLYIATGGVGIQTHCRLRTLIADEEANGTDDAVDAIAFDTDRDELREACSNRWASPLTLEDTLHLPLKLPQSYDNARDILGWVSRRWLYNIPRSLETRGYRPLGRVALVDHSRHVVELIRQKLSKLTERTKAADASGVPLDSMIRVVILTGTGGGTGAGMTLDIANAVRSVAVELNVKVEVHGIFVCTCFASKSSSPLVAANTYALLTEIAHATASGNQSAANSGAQVLPFESADAPFDFTHWLPAQDRNREENSTDTLDTIARYLAFERRPEIRGAVRTCRATPTPHEPQNVRTLSMRKFGFATLPETEDPASHAIEAATTDLLQCGHDRRTLVVTPLHDIGQIDTAEQICRLRPLAHVVPADVANLVVVSEDSAISPRSVALGLERVFPGIADAARRLFTRIDIDWQSLV